MSQTRTPIRQLAIGSVAVLTTALTFGATVTPAPAVAQSGVYYRATLETPVEKRTEVIRGGTFICSGTICVGTKARSRPALVCERLAREFGVIADFTVNGKALEEADMAACRADEAA